MIDVGLLLILAFTTAGFLWLTDRRDRRVHEERHAWSLERVALLQRIQAPEMAVVQHAQAEADPVMTVPPLSDEEQAALAEMARLEREFEARRA